MKFIFTTLALMTSVTLAQTSGEPFGLPAGKYTSECWIASASQDNGRFEQYQEFEKGTLSVAVQGDIRTESYGGQGSHYRYDSVTKIQQTDLGYGVYKLNISVTSKYVDEDQVRNSKLQTNVTVVVEGQSSRNLKVQTNGQPEKEGNGATSWMKMSDGRIVVQSYNLKPKRYEDSEGSVYEEFASNRLCVYSLADQPSKNH